MLTRNVRLLMAIAGIALPWLAAPAVVAVVVDRNAREGIYGTSDAVLIPIASSVVLCAIGLIYFGTLLFFVLQRFNSAKFAPGFCGWSWFILLLALAVPGALLLLAICAYWWSWQHAPIVCVYALALVWLAWATYVIARSRRSTASIRAA